MDRRWVLSLPGLRRFREQLSRVDRQHQQVERQRTRIQELEVSLARQKRRNTRLEQMAPSGQTVAHVLHSRLQALLRSSKSREAVERERRFSHDTPEYLRNCQSGSLGLDSELVEQVKTHGLTFWVPRNPGESGDLANRILRRGWLPIDAILGTRELGVGSIMLDIGANIGTTSIPRVAAGDVECVYAAEPDPLNYACLVRNIRDNRLGGFVLPCCVAISDADGEAVLERAGSMGTQQLVARTPAGSPSAADGKRVIVQTTTLDNWVRRLRVEPELICLVKSDTQGWECHVLRGAPQLLAHRHIAWIIEFSPGHLTRAGSSPAMLIEQLQRHFTHFVDLRGTADGPRVREVADLETALVNVVERRRERYTDLLLYSAG